MGIYLTICWLGLGFLIAITTLWSTALWTSKLNIVSALRGGLTRAQVNLPWPLLLVQICSLAGAVLSLLVLLVLGFDSPFAYLLWTMGGVFVLITIIPILTWELPISLRNKSRFWQRKARHASRNIRMAGLVCCLCGLYYLGDWIRYATK